MGNNHSSKFLFVHRLKYYTNNKSILLLSTYATASLIAYTENHQLSLSINVTIGERYHFFLQHSTVPSVKVHRGAKNLFGRLRLCLSNSILF